ncbi:MAG: hypothetical protein CMJ23_03870 [Phycisphaerae bacterium]|nr:hypothetical protein [Phycisphaerae bacterium]
MTAESSTSHAVVVGITSRTGRAIADLLNRNGWSIEGTSRDLQAAETEVERLGGGGRAASVDLSSEESIDRFLAARAGGPNADLLVVAGAPFEENPLGEATMKDFLYQAAAQAAGPALLAAGMSAELKRSRRPGGGAVVLFGDIHARLRPRAGATPYLAGKAGLESLVALLAVELAPVRVFGLAPGVIAWADEFDQARRDEYLRRVPLGRAGTVEEAAALARSLVDSATYTTGIVIPIDGGRHLR